MENVTPDADLLHSLRKLASGLTALFWGLPAVLLISAETARAEYLHPVEVVPALVANLVLLYGIRQMCSFQKQERPWRNALDRAKLLGLINLGLCPFLFWFNHMPEQTYFRDAIFVLIFSGLFFLFNLNVVLKQLGAMLPDETLRHDVNLFTALNRWLLGAWLLIIIIAMTLPQLTGLWTQLNPMIQFLIARAEAAALLFLGLSPLAVTMALIWKTKEVIFDSVFGAK